MLAERISARTIDEAECVASVALAIAVAHGLGATNIAWAAFAGYMVMRGHAAETVQRGLLRIAGTIAGAALALLVTPWAVPRWPLAALALLLIGTASLYAALTARRSYAWLFLGLTFAMVIVDQLEHPAAPLGGFIETRILETLAGTLACVAVSLASAVSLRRRWPATPIPASERLGWRPQALRHAAQGGVALALLVGLSRVVAVPALAQAAITIMAAMLVPVGGIGRSGLLPVSRRLLHRGVGCGAGALLAALSLFAAHGRPMVLIAATLIGVAIGRHIENGAHSRRYVGTQFTLAVLVVLVPDSYAGAALERLAGIGVGMAVLVPVLLAWHLLTPGRAAPRGVAGRESTDI